MRVVKNETMQQMTDCSLVPLESLTTFVYYPVLLLVLNGLREK